MSKAKKFTIAADKETSFPQWYKEILTLGEILDYHDISGCYVLRPNGYFIWDTIRKFFTEKIEDLGVREAYFPMLVSKSALEKEQAHLENFAPEVAWITECGGKPLESPVAIRPTSEAIMYPYFAKWIQSYRDLPLKVNQWCNILRWEMTQTMPFVRGREFLWQEGHTAHLHKQEMDTQVYEILDIYADVYRNLLAVPVIKGKKSIKETFAGASYTTTVEAFVSSTGKGIQAATSHALGTSFSKMFGVSVEDPAAPGTQSFVHQTSWGLSTRSIGVCILVHADSRGIILPPQVAYIQVVIVLCGVTKKAAQENTQQRAAEVADDLLRSLKKKGIRAHLDNSSATPGHKFNHWEVRGVPLRIEIGPQDIQMNRVTVARRICREKKECPIDQADAFIEKELEEIQEAMYQKAKAEADASTTSACTVDELLTAVQNKKMVYATWCGAEECEAGIKEKTQEKDAQGVVTSSGAKSLCIPFERPSLPLSDKCIGCSREPTCVGLFGRCY